MLNVTHGQKGIMTAQKPKPSKIAAYLIRAYQSYHLKTQRLHELDEDYLRHLERLRNVISRFKKKRNPKEG